jgi:DNA-binding NarL/FixJ family response regulator
MSEQISKSETPSLAQELWLNKGQNEVGGFPVGAIPAVVIPPQFTDRQYHVLALASLGGTTKSVARLLACRQEEVAQTRDELIAEFEVPNMAAVVNQVILQKNLPIRVASDSELRLSTRERIILDGFRRGLGNKAIGKQVKLAKGTIREYSYALFQKVKSNGRTHSVRRSYELGIFELPHDDRLTDD